jgi:hypothetical protein
VTRAFDPDPLVIDHLLLVTSRQHRRRYQRAWRRMVLEGKGGVREPHIMHEHDDSCCELEPWAVSIGKLIDASGAKTLVVLL